MIAGIPKGAIGTRLLLAPLLFFAGAAATAQTPPPPSTVTRLEERVATIDIQRLMTDSAYARSHLPVIEQLHRAPQRDEHDRVMADGLWAGVLAGAGRAAEGRAAVDALLARRSPEPIAYILSWWTAGVLNDWPRMLDTVEAAAANVPAAEWGELYRAFVPATISQLSYAFEAGDDEERRFRLADALVRIGWPGAADAEAGDEMRMIMIDHLLSHGARERAAAIAGTLSTPDNLLPLLSLRKYDGLLPAARATASGLESVLAARDAATAAALAEQPGTARLILVRARFLRGVGREADALAILLPQVADVPRAAAEPDGMWLIEEATNALLALGRVDEALALGRRLLALDVGAHPLLINPMINHVWLIWKSGRFAEALEQARGLERQFPTAISDFGKAMLDSTIVCALASLDRQAEARSWMSQLRAHSGESSMLRLRASLCLNDLDAAASSLQRGLEADDPTYPVLSLQDYSLGALSPASEQLRQRLLSLRTRPAVAAALARVGRVARFPLSRNVWGDL